MIAGGRVSGGGEAVHANPTHNKRPVLPETVALMEAIGENRWELLFYEHAKRLFHDAVVRCGVAASEAEAAASREAVREAEARIRRLWQPRSEAAVGLAVEALERMHAIKTFTSSDLIDSGIGALVKPLRKHSDASVAGWCKLDPSSKATRFDCEKDKQRFQLETLFV